VIERTEVVLFSVGTAHRGARSSLYDFIGLHYFFATTWRMSHDSASIARGPNQMSAAAASSTNDGPLWEVDLEPGEHWSGVLRRGVSLRITAAGARANVSAAMYYYENLLERYNMADTLKAQHTAFLTKGNVCYSDMGRVLCSITEDSTGWHDTICGVSDAQLVAERYGERRFDDARNAFHKNGRDSLLNELGKYGLGKRDLISTVNFFSRVWAEDDGTLRFDPDHCPAGSHVTLRFEMPTLLALTTCQHPLDPSSAYAPQGARLTAWWSGTAPAEDPCRGHCPENGRGFANTEALFLT
jgi:uncharacterized protein